MFYYDKSLQYKSRTALLEIFKGSVDDVLSQRSARYYSTRGFGV